MLFLIYITHLFLKWWSEVKVAQSCQSVVLEKTVESPLDCKGIKPVNPKGNQSWIFIGRTDAETDAPICWPPDTNSRLIRKDPEAGKDWSQEKGMTEDKMVGWHHWFSGHEFEQALGNGEGQGSLACCTPWGHKESDTTEQLNNCFILPKNLSRECDHLWICKQIAYKDLTMSRVKTEFP